MKKLIIAFSIIVGIAGIGYGISKFIASQIKGAMNFCYKISNISFIDLSAKLITFKLQLKFLQNSDFRVKINSYDIDIIINGKKVVKINERKTVDVLPKAVSFISTIVSFSPEKIFKGGYIGDLIYSATLNQKNFIIQTKGTMNATVNFLPLSIPIDVKMSLAEILKPVPVDPKEEKMICKIY